MKLRNILVVGLIVILLSMAVSVQAAPAAPATDLTLIPEADDLAYISDTASVLDDEELLRVQVSLSPGFISQQEAFLRFYLGGASGVPDGEVITSAKLVLRSTVTSGAAMTMHLYGSTVNNWSEGTAHLTWAERSAISAVLTDLTATSGLMAAGGDVTFNSTTEFVKFLNQQLATPDKLATLTIAATGGSGLAAYQRMASKDNTTGKPVPQLILTSAPSTAVTMSTFQAANPAVSWPLIAGLGALVALTAGGALFYRKRATTH